MVRGHMIFLHNRFEREEGNKGSNPGGVAIILSPTAVMDWKEDGSNPPITTHFYSKFVGIFVGIKMSFPRFDKWGKIVSGFLKLFVASIYHPVNNKEHGEFNETLKSLVSSLPKTVQFIGGHDVNANLSMRKLMHKRVNRIYGLKNHNKKGQNLLGIFGANNLRVVNSFFKKRNYTTCRYFNKSRPPHVLDVITCSTSFFRFVNDCIKIPDGVQSDHSVVWMVFLNRSIKFKSDYIERPVVDWKNIKKFQN